MTGWPSSRVHRRQFERTEKPRVGCGRHSRIVRQVDVPMHLGECLTHLADTYRQTRTGIVLCSKTFCVSLPSITRFKPCQPWVAMTMRSQ